MGTLNVNTLAAPGGTTTISNATVVNGNFESNGIDDNVGSSGGKKIVLSTTDGEHVLIKGDLKVEDNLEVLGSVVNQSSNAIWARWSGTINVAAGAAIADVTSFSTVTSSGLDSTPVTISSGKLRVDFKPSVDADDYTVVYSIASRFITVNSTTKNAGNFKLEFYNSDTGAASDVSVDIIMAV